MIAPMILQNFRGRPSHVAVADDGKTFRPVELQTPLRPDWLQERHLGGAQCLGFYLMTEDSQVYCSAVDFDNKPENPDIQWMDKAEKVYYLLLNAGLSPLVEISQSGNAAHVWLFFSEPVSAKLVREFWNGVSLRLEIKFPEIYPRQDVLSGKGLGNLIRYPLWNKSHFPDVENEWRELDPLKALEGVKQTNATELRMVAFQLGLGDLRETVETSSEGNRVSSRVNALVNNRHSLVAKRWRGEMEGLSDNSRSALCQSIACELVRLYVPTTEIEQAIRHWCEENGYEKGERDDWVCRTVAKAYEFVISRQEKKSIETSTLKEASIAYIDSLVDGHEPIIGSGIHEIDFAVAGVALGEMCVLAARPGHGKTAMGLNWVMNAAARQVESLVISEEMTKIALGKRALLRISEIASEEWPEHLPSLKKEVEAFHTNRNPIHLVENCHTIDRCEEVIDQHCAVFGVKLVAVDYLQLLSGRGSNRYENVTEISMRLKKAALRNNCALLTLCQLNRGIDSRENHEPKLSDLRESGQIEQDADLVIFGQWAWKVDPQINPEVYYFYFAKNRNRGINGGGKVAGSFDGARQRFERSSPVFGNFNSNDHF